MIDYLVIISFFVVALLYSSVGHAGASGYLAIMAIAGLMPEVMRPTALALNILVSSIVTYRFSKAGLIKWNKLFPLIVSSIPFAFLGGTIKLPDEIYKPILGIILIYKIFLEYIQCNNFLFFVFVLSSIRYPFSFCFICLHGVLLFAQSCNSIDLCIHQRYVV